MRARPLILVLAGFLAALPAAAQQPTARSDFTTPFDSHAAPTSPAAPQGLLHLDVAVTTAGSGQPVLGLQPSDFTLLDNGKPAKIVSFHAYSIAAPPERPVAITLVVDTLEVPKVTEMLERAQAEAFLRQNGGHFAGFVSVLILNRDGLWLAGLPSTNGNALAEAVAHNRLTRWDAEGWDAENRDAENRDTENRDTENRSTESRGALDPAWNQHAPFSVAGPPAVSANGRPAEVALRVLGAVATTARREPGRKVLLWIGPRPGVGSALNPERARTPQEKLDAFDKVVWFSDLFRLAHLTLCDDPVSDSRLPAPVIPRSHVAPVSTPENLTAPDHSIAALNRQVLAVESGGRVVDPLLGDPIPQLNGCLRGAESLYALTFNPPPTQDLSEYHSLSIKLGASMIAARTNTGYYDQPWYSDAPDSSLRRVTVDQLDRLLSTVRTRADAEIAHQLSGLELTERASAGQVAAWSAQLRGRKSREALLALTDSAAFLDPPVSAVPSDPPPDRAAQQRMISLAAGYLQQTIPRLPDFFAQRSSVEYQETPPFYRGDGRFSTGEPLHVAAAWKTTVLYRNGREVVFKPSRREDASYVYGTFGPMLSVVAEALGSGVRWSHWETSAPGKRIAVFRYAVPASRSHYRVSGCCTPEGGGTTGFATMPGYHGHIAIDPATGALLRVEVVADLAGFVPVDRSAIMVSYGPVDIGGRSYICPLHSVSIWRARSVHPLSAWNLNFLDWGPSATRLDDFRFDNYHIFRAKIRMILPGSSE